jgi:hypothetical protein
MIPTVLLDLNTEDKLVAMAQLDFFNNSARKLLKNGYMFELCLTAPTREILKSHYNIKKQGVKNGRHTK